jgi:enhancer of polycomb-like protein
MGRSHNPGSLRNRNRITPKSRLKIVLGNVDADSIVLEEDEEKARIVSTAGVDAEDANVSTVVPLCLADCDWLVVCGCALND